MLTSFDNEEYVLQALLAGARGYVLKSASDAMLVSTIRAIYQGDHVLSPQVTGSVVQRLIADRSPATLPQTITVKGFAEEERQILWMLVTGASNIQIAEELYLSHTTVKRKLCKMQVESRAQAAVEAVRHGLV